MNLPRYKDILILAKEKIRETMAPLRAKEMRKKAELEACKIDSEVLDKEQKIAELAQEYPLNFDKIIEVIDDLDLLKRRKSQYESIINQLFGEE